MKKGNLLNALFQKWFQKLLLITYQTYQMHFRKRYWLITYQTYNRFIVIIITIIIITIIIIIIIIIIIYYYYCYYPGKKKRNQSTNCVLTMICLVKIRTWIERKFQKNSRFNDIDMDDIYTQKILVKESSLVILKEFKEGDAFLE